MNGYGGGKASCSHSPFVRQIVMLECMVMARPMKGAKLMAGRSPVLVGVSLKRPPLTSGEPDALTYGFHKLKLHQGIPVKVLSGHLDPQFQTSGDDTSDQQWGCECKISGIRSNVPFRPCGQPLFGPYEFGNIDWQQQRHAEIRSTAQDDFLVGPEPWTPANESGPPTPDTPAARPYQIPLPYSASGWLAGSALLKASSSWQALWMRAMVG